MTHLDVGVVPTSVGRVDLRHEDGHGRSFVVGIECVGREFKLCRTWEVVNCSGAGGAGPVAVSRPARPSRKSKQGAAASKSPLLTGRILKPTWL